MSAPNHSGLAGVRSRFRGLEMKQGPLKKGPCFVFSLSDFADLSAQIMQRPDTRQQHKGLKYLLFGSKI